jgi:hypothetical protein
VPALRRRWPAVERPDWPAQPACVLWLRLVLSPHRPATTGQLSAARAEGVRRRELISSLFSSATHHHHQIHHHHHRHILFFSRVFIVKDYNAFFLFFFFSWSLHKIVVFFILRIGERRPHFLALCLLAACIARLALPALASRNSLVRPHIEHYLLCALAHATRSCASATHKHRKKTGEGEKIRHVIGRMAVTKRKKKKAAKSELRLSRARGSET